MPTQRQGLLLNLQRRGLLPQRQTTIPYTAPGPKQILQGPIALAANSGPKTLLRTASPFWTY